MVVSPDEVRTNYEVGFAKTDASVIRLKAADYAAVPEPTEEEIKKYFNDQKDQFKQPERRKVQYVKFGLDDAQQKLTGRERMDALKPLADRAAQVLDKLLEQKGKADFAAVAAADHLTVQETPEFEEDQSGGYPEAAVAGFAQAAFKLSPANPDSDVPLEVPPRNPTAYYDLHLSGVTPERPLTLDEARPKIVTALKTERASAALTAKAEEIRTKIAEALKAGRPFADAAKEAGLPAQDLPPFSLAEMDRSSPDTEEAARVSIGLAAGELSTFTPDKGWRLSSSTCAGARRPTKPNSRRRKAASRPSCRRARATFISTSGCARAATTPDRVSTCGPRVERTPRHGPGRDVRGGARPPRAG